MPRIKIQDLAEDETLDAKALTAVWGGQGARTAAPLLGGRGLPLGPRPFGLPGARLPGRPAGPSPGIKRPAGS